MRSLPSVVILMILMLWLVTPVVAAPTTATLTFAALPTETPDIIHRNIRPFLNDLEDQLQIKIDVFYSSSYQHLLDSFLDNTVDLAFLGPLPYVTLKQQKPEAQPVVTFLEDDGSPFYTCALLTTIDGVNDPLDLTGMPLALTNPLSTCGYLVTESILASLGLSLKQTGYDYLKRHDLVALSVARGEYAGGGVKTSIGKRYLHLGLQILAESKPVPGRPLIANGATVSPEMIEKIRRFATTATAVRPDKDLIKQPHWGPVLLYGAVSASDKDFDHLREMLNGREIPAQ